MKSQITKIVSLLVCVCLIVSGMILSTSAAGTTVTYTASSYSNPSSTGVANATKTFNDGIITFGAYGGGSSGSVAFRSDEIRVYQGAYATMTSTQDITSVTFNIKGKSATTVNISTSTDGSSWTVVKSAASLTTSFADVTVNFDPATKYIKLSDASKQIIIKSIKVTYAAVGGNQGGDGDDNTGAGGTTPTPTPTPTDPADGSTLTIPEALALAESKDANVYTTNKYYVEGEIKNVYNAQYGNMYIKDANGNELCIYGTYSADGSISYNAMTTKPVAGDTIKVYGVIGKYVKSDGSVTTLQMKNGWIITHTPATPSNPSNPDDNQGGATPAPEKEYEVVGTVAANTAYKLAQVQGGKTLYITGAMVSTYYFATSENIDEAVDVKLEAVTGGYNLTTVVDGAKKYINIVKSGTHTNAKYEDAASSVYTFDAEKKILVTDVEGEAYTLGTYSTYASMSPVKVSDDTNIFANLYAEKKAPAGDDNQGGNTNTGAGTNTGANTNTNTNTNTGSTTTTTPAPEKSPETGDSIALYIVMMAISAAAMVLVAKKRFA